MFQGKEKLSSGNSNYVQSVEDPKMVVCGDTGKEEVGLNRQQRIWGW